MNATDIVGYAYDAALHCVDCAAKQGMDKPDTTDGEGNPVHPVFCGEDSHGETCDDCFESLDGSIRLHCDQCEMLSINGVACHERGCPNIGARWDGEQWIKQRECFECGCTVDADAECCNGEPEPDHPRRWFTTSSGRIELEIKLEDAQSGSHQGQCDDDVRALSAVPYIRAQLDALNADSPQN